MGNKTVRKMLAVLIALVMIMTSGAAVFAAGTKSPDKGNTNPPRVWNLGTTNSYVGKWFNHKYGGSDIDYFRSEMRTPGGSWQSAVTRKTSPSKLWRGLKDGGLYEFRAKGGSFKSGEVVSGVVYRWMMWARASAKSSSKGQFTVNWQKVSGASYYQVQYSKSKSMSGATSVYASSASTSYTIKAGSGTWYYRVCPVKQSNGHSYIGIYSPPQAVSVK